MASGLSKAHQRQQSVNKVSRAARRTAAVTEINALKRLLRHARKMGLTIKLGPNSSDATFMLGNKRALPELGAAWARAAARTSVAGARNVLALRGIPQANVTVAVGPMVR